MNKENKNKSVLAESLVDLKNIEDFVSKSSEKTISNILKEQVKQELKNIILEADDFEEEEVDSDTETEDVQDTETELEDDFEGENETEVEDVETDEVEDVEGDMEGMDSETDDVESEYEDEEEDFDLDSYKTGEDEYDLTNNNIEDVIKVFKKIDDNDSVIVKKLENGKVELIDNEAGTEYLIDMEDGELESDDDEIEIELDDEMEDEDDGLTESADIEIELDGEEDYVSEKNMTQSIGTNRRAGRMTQTRKAYAPGANNRDGAKLIAAEGKKIAKEYNDKLSLIENSYKKKLRALNNEISEYKNALVMFRDKLKENAVLNNNLAKYVKLVTENATTQDEKVAILKRFSTEANTIESGNNLFESINKSLKEKGTPDVGVNIDKQMSVESNVKRLDEQVIYQSKDLQATIGLINRMKGL